MSLEILNLHAQGGMAEVYRARATFPDGTAYFYAMKRIKPEFVKDAELVKMFVEEARVATRLVHPSIVRVFDLVVSTEQQHFIIMEFVDGKDAADLLWDLEQKKTRPPIWLAVHVCREVLRALDYATTQAQDEEGKNLGLIHRDISPHNVIVCYDGRVMLADFGVAKVEQARVRTQVGIIKGKFGYMSPEQLRSEPLDFRSDLYNVGILLYEMLTNGRLFPGDTPVEAVSSMLKGDVPALPEALGCPPELERLMRQALSRKREDRPQTAAAFERALADIALRYRLEASAGHVARIMQDHFGAERERELEAIKHLPRINSLIFRGGQSLFGGVQAVPAAPLDAAPPLPSEPPPSQSVTSSSRTGSRRAERAAPPDDPAPSIVVEATPPPATTTRPPQALPSLPPLPPPARANARVSSSRARADAALASAGLQGPAPSRPATAPRAAASASRSAGSRPSTSSRVQLLAPEAQAAPPPARAPSSPQAPPFPPSPSQPVRPALVSDEGEAEDEGFDGVASPRTALLSQHGSESFDDHTNAQVGRLPPATEAFDAPTLPPLPPVNAARPALSAPFRPDKSEGGVFTAARPAERSGQRRATLDDELPFGDQDQNANTREFARQAAPSTSEESPTDPTPLHLKLPTLGHNARVAPLVDGKPPPPRPATSGGLSASRSSKSEGGSGGRRPPSTSLPPMDPGATVIETNPLLQENKGPLVAASGRLRAVPLKDGKKDGQREPVKNDADKAKKK